MVVEVGILQLKPGVNAADKTSGAGKVFAEVVKEIEAVPDVKGVKLGMQVEDPSVLEMLVQSVLLARLAG
jgi:hypothetical protein